MTGGALGLTGAMLSETQVSETWGYAVLEKQTKLDGFALEKESLY